jgi:hypothetical protein
LVIIVFLQAYCGCADAAQPPLFEGWRQTTTRASPQLAILQADNNKVFVAVDYFFVI